jgi:hypothetical protein
MASLEEALGSKPCNHLFLQPQCGNDQDRRKYLETPYDETPYDTQDTGITIPILQH